MVKTGLHVLLDEHINELSGLRVGVLANQASVTNDGVNISDALVNAGVKVNALFGPEHGIRGVAAPGEAVSDSFDEKLGIPVFSLYGDHRSPTADSLDLIDVMLVDLQDVGARFYTFIWTMAHVMIACGHRGIPVWVLDRPNPISGTNPEGPILEPCYESYVGMYPIPIRHGLTIAELARLLVARFDVNCELRVVPMQGWRREMFWGETSLRWTKPSPSMLRPSTALYYPGTCLLEGTNVSEGRGTDFPFEMVGAQWVDLHLLCNTLKVYDLPGIEFSSCSWNKDEEIFHGIRLNTSDRNAFRPVLTGIALLCALKAACKDDFQFNKPSADGRFFFDLLAGNSRLRESIEAGFSPWDIANEWEDGISDFQELVSGILVYE